MYCTYDRPRLDPYRLGQLNAYVSLLSHRYHPSLSDSKLPKPVELSASSLLTSVQLCTFSLTSTPCCVLGHSWKCESIPSELFVTCAPVWSPCTCSSLPSPLSSPSISNYGHSAPLLCSAPLSTLLPISLLFLCFTPSAPHLFVSLFEVTLPHTCACSRALKFSVILDSPIHQAPR